MLNNFNIEALFDACFRQDWEVCLLGGAEEPLYLPASEETGAARLYYREDFAASALHEVAHWCIAGPRRRACVDFGYTYVAPPRTLLEQQNFFAAELRTQSLESVFARAADVTFHVSADAPGCTTAEFAQAVACHATKTHQWLRTPAGSRANRFLQILSAATGGSYEDRADG